MRLSWAALAALTVVRLAVAAATPLSPDEAYSWVWSRALAVCYPDHPGMVALWVRIGTWLAGDGALGVRLLAPLATALGSVLLYRAGEDLLPGRGAGLTAAVLLNATLLMGIGAVTMTPDTPLIFFWTATIWALGRVYATGRGGWWLVAGAAAGFSLDSKYTAVLLLPCVAAWIGAVPSLRAWLRRPGPWLAAGLVIALFSPVLAWNAGHQWVSIAKQSARAADWNPSRALQFVVELLAGQIGLATPLIALLCGAGIVLAARRARCRDPAWTLLATLTVIPSLVFLQHALGDRVQANWPAVLYPAAAIAAAGLPPRWLRLVRPGVALGLAITVVVWLQAVAAPLPLPARWDPTLVRLGGWDGLAAAVDTARRQEGAAFVAADNYGDAAILARTLPAEVPVLGIDARWSLFDLPDAQSLIAGRSGLLLRSARRESAPDPADWSQIVPLGVLERTRDGMTAEDFFLYRVVGRPGAVPVAVMPRPR
jgi:4-amino-4-deoxy-L-arabinose transferase-like glycosyltransferase